MYISGITVEKKKNVQKLTSNGKLEKESRSHIK